MGIKKQPIFVTWKGKVRKRVLNKPKFWNSVQWLLEEGKTPKEIKEILYNDKIPNLKKRKVEEKIVGKGFIARKKYQIKFAILKSLGHKIYRSEFPASDTW